MTEKTTEEISDPIITKIQFTEKDLQGLAKKLSQGKEYILEYPTVYIIYSKNEESYQVYVGETNNINQRTREHFKESGKYGKNSEMIVIGHEHFNKSLTLDIENKIMLYMTGVDAVKNITNRRDNPQYKYFPSSEMEAIFSKTWRGLKKSDEKLFPIEKIIQDNALFKASPFHKLTYDQLQAKNQILMRVQEVVQENGETHQLILVEGEAGSGKTVLLSSLFYALSGQDDGFKNASSYMVVNHEEQVKVYKSIAQKLSIERKNKERVMRSTRFINKISKDNPADITLVDEAHLLLTRKNQSYFGESQIADIVDRSKVTIAVLDKHQILKTDQYIEDSKFEELENEAKKRGNLIKLKEQLRMSADKDTVMWIKELVYGKKVLNLPKNDDKYDLRIFKSAKGLYKAIEQKNSESEENGLSRILATYDWKYSSTKQKSGKLYEVETEDFKLPWNLQVSKDSKKFSWVEREDSINEVGSTYTIQGFDLNYSGVIIGPSVKYRNGKIIYDPKDSSNKNAIQNRTISDGTKVKVFDKLLPNELNVLLTRGVNGLYIYAADEELRKALLKAQNGEMK